MEILALDPDRPDPAVMRRAAEILARGGLAAYPTETLYGLAADIRREDALARLWQLKGRAADQPVAVIAADRAMLEGWVEIPAAAERLIAAFWPGPLTLVLPAKPAVSRRLLAGAAGLGVRVPGSAAARALSAALGAPITATSANRSGGPDPTGPGEVEKALGAGLDLLLDAGLLRPSRPSTVVELVGPQAKILREGAIAQDALRPYLNFVVVA